MVSFDAPVPMDTIPVAGGLPLTAQTNGMPMAAQVSVDAMGTDADGDVVLSNIPRELPALKVIFLSATHPAATRRRFYRRGTEFGAKSACRARCTG